MIEFVDIGSCTSAHPTPVLFVHGAYHGAWCWTDHFLGYFARRGFRALAMSLRGHGRSDPTVPGPYRIADYVVDLENAVNRVGAAPILVGHSMGGFVVQKYLEDRIAPPTVLLASAPPRTVWRTAPALLARHPWVMLRTIAPGSRAALVHTPDLVREHLFSNSTPAAVVSACAARLQADNGRAQWDMLALNRVNPNRISAPVLVVGATQDGLISHKQVHDTARAYGTTAQFTDDAGHNLMLEASWQTTADVIIEWLASKQL